MNRTRNLPITDRLLYQLSYVGVGAAGLEPTTSTVSRWRSTN
jgi:hypothetical protein